MQSLLKIAVPLIEKLLVQYEPQLLAAVGDLATRLATRYKARLTAWLEGLVVTPPATTGETKPEVTTTTTTTAT